MGQKVNPHGLRVGVIKDWDSRWYAEDADFADNLVEDYKIREFLKKKLMKAGVAKIEIERSSDRIKIFLHTAKPGVVIGKGGAEIGEVSGIIESYLQSCWKWSVEKKSQIMHGAKLYVETIPAITYCEDCKQTYETVQYGKICPRCGSEHTYLLQGNEFNIKEIEGC